MWNKRNKAILLVFILNLFIFCKDESNPRLKTIEITIEGHQLIVEVAQTDEERQRGLMFRKSMGDNEGMLFVWDRDDKRYFYMKNTFLPLSLAFINSDATIVQIENMTPFSEKIVESHSFVRYALEVKQGTFERLGIKPGAKIIFPSSF